MTTSHSYVVPTAGKPAQGSAITVSTKHTANHSGWIVRPALGSPHSNDTALLAEMLTQLSAESLWNRFGMALYPLTVERAMALANRMLASSVADTTLLVVAAPGGAERVCALAQLVATGPHSAEFALLVADDLQGQGLGRQLFALLVERAHAAGLHTLTASMRASNNAILRVVRHAGLPVSVSTSSGETDVVVRLAALAAPLHSVVTNTV